MSIRVRCRSYLYFEKILFHNYYNVMFWGGIIFLSSCAEIIDYAEFVLLIIAMAGLCGSVFAKKH
jgi:hypothetical protein